MAIKNLWGDMFIDNSQVKNGEEWVSALEAQLQTKPSRLSLSGVFNENSPHTLHISSPTRKALEGHGLGFVLDCISECADMDLIILGKEEFMPASSSSDAVLKHFHDSSDYEIKYARADGDDELLQNLLDEREDTLESIEECDPVSTIMLLPQNGMEGVIVLPDLDAKFSTTSRGDLITLDDWPNSKFGNPVHEILYMIFHEAGHIRARHALDESTMNVIKRLAADSPFEIDVDDIPEDKVNSVFLRQEIEADFFCLDVMDALEKLGKLKLDPNQKSAYLAQRALDALSGDWEHAVAPAITTNGLREGVDAHHLYNGLQRVYEELKDRGLGETVGDETYFIQNPKLYKTVKDIADEDKFHKGSVERAYVDQFLAAAEVFAPRHFGLKKSANLKDVAIFNETLDC